VEAANDGQGGLAMVSNSDTVPVGKVEVQVVPFKDVLPGLVLAKENLRTEEANLEARKVVPFALKNGDVASVI
jgi:hypothetical protein